VGGADILVGQCDHGQGQVVEGLQHPLGGKPAGGAAEPAGAQAAKQPGSRRRGQLPPDAVLERSIRTTMVSSR
jgi:hypothetical protein